MLSRQAWKKNDKNAILHDKSNRIPLFTSRLTKKFSVILFEHAYSQITTVNISETIFATHGRLDNVGIRSYEYHTLKIISRHLTNSTL
jgi:hypothetical protein